MKYKLIAPVQYSTPIAQVLNNRGVEEPFQKYINASMADVSPPEAFGEEKMHAGVKMVARHDRLLSSHLTQHGTASAIHKHMFV